MAFWSVVNINHWVQMNKFYCKVVGEHLGLTVQATLLPEVVSKGHGLAVVVSQLSDYRIVVFR